MPHQNGEHGSKDSAEMMMTKFFIKLVSEYGPLSTNRMKVKREIDKYKVPVEKPQTVIPFSWEDGKK